MVWVLVLFFLTASCSTTALSVKAEHRTIIVPDNYRAITDAVGNATNGDTILVRSGIYNEQSLKTNKTISLIGEGAHSTIVKLTPPIVNFTVMGQYIGTGYDAAIDFRADNIVVSGFTINCYGAIMISGDHVILMGNTINNYEKNWVHVNGNYATISNNTLNVVTDVQCSYSGVSANTGTGIITVSNWGSYNSVFYNNMSSIGGATLSSSNLYYGNIVTGGGGMYAMKNDIVANNTITNCTQGVNIMMGSDNVIVGNIIANNSGTALATIGYVQGSLTYCGLNNLFLANYVANNALGIRVSTNDKWHTGNFTIYYNDFINNTQQAEVIVSDSSTYWDSSGQGLPCTDYWNTTYAGNHWSDYNGTDENGDGIGDSPYLVGGNESDYQPLMAPFNIYSINIQLPSWAILSLPNPLPIPSFPPPPSSSPSPIPNSTPSPNPSSSSASSPAPLPTQEPAPTLAAIVILSASAIAISMGAIIYFRKHKH